jgi:hypothetical protein
MGSAQSFDLRGGARHIARRQRAVRGGQFLTRVAARHGALL